MSTNTTPITLKWGKQTLNLTVQSNDNKGQISGLDLKQQIFQLTNVPPTRQKLLCPKLWKGALKDADYPNIPDNITENTKITLIGTIETLIEKSIEDRPRFIEDMTDEEIWQLQKHQNDGGSNNNHPIIDIVALQKEHGMNRDDGKMEMYEYNRLVTGLPQQQINDMLCQRLETTDAGEEQQQQQQQQQKQSSLSTELHGELAMTMGLQLRRAYINSLAVLHNGTLISGLDDGHVQLWRRGMMVKDARHNGGCVDEVVVFPSGDESFGSGTLVPAFATAGDGTICLWTEDGNCIMSLPCFPGTTVASLAVGITNARSSMHHHQYYLAACFRITREVDPNQFRLPPQNEAERRRREAAELREQMIQNQLLDVSRRVKVWMYDESQRNNANGGVVFREELITPHSSNVEIESIAPPSVTKIVDMNCGNLVCGDVRGIKIFDQNRDMQPSFQRKLALQFQYLCDIDCMQPINGHLLAVAVSRISDEEELVPADAVGLQIPIARGVYIVDTESASVRAILNGHSDRVKCICPLPDGGILTAGGKFDATTQLWCSDALWKVTKMSQGEDEDSEETVILSKPKKLKNPGYVFDLKVLPDRNCSNVYAIAAARYNTINIII